VPAASGPRKHKFSDDPSSTGPLTVSDLLAQSGQSVQRSGRRVAARQAVVEVRRHRVRRFFAVSLTLLVTLLASAAAYYVGLFFYLDETIARVDALAVDAPGILSPQAQETADNFLIVGSETVAGQAQVTSALIAHLAPGRDGAVLVSLPLTALIDVPACPSGEEQLLADPYGGSLASSFATAGAGCLVRSVQQLSGMRMDHYVQLDLDRLPSMVDALGGVPVCLPPELATGDQSAGSGGTAVLDADQVRALLTRVEADQDPTGQLATDRQRLLLASTLREALRLENLANPIVLTGFVNEAANALTLDPGTTLGELRDLGNKLGEFTAGDTVQASVPLAQVAYRPVGSERSYALIDDAASREMFRAIIANSDLPPVGRPASGSDASPAPAPPANPIQTTPPPAPDPNALTVAPQQITVNVFNGVGTRGLATDAADGLSAQGFIIGEIENQITGATQSVVRYAPDQFEAARTVAAAVPESILREGNSAGGSIDLVVGSSFTGVVPVVIPTPAPPPPTSTPAEASPTAPTPIESQRQQSCG